jgi:hypothetical protein
VTPRRTAPADEPYTPDDTLIDKALGPCLDGKSLVLFPFERSTFVNAMVSFGPLPKRGQRDLIDCLTKLYLANQPVQIMPIAPSKVRDRVKNIETAARKMLLLLGINKKGAEILRHREEHWPASDRSSAVGFATEDILAGVARLRLSTAGTAGTPITVDRLQAWSRVHPGLPIQLPQNPGLSRLNNFIFDLSWLQRQAETAAGEVGKRTLHGRGGARVRPTPQGKLMREAIAVYVAMRRQYPKSGHKPGYGGPLLRFVYAVADLCRTRVTDQTIRDVWRSIRKSF